LSTLSFATLSHPATIEAEILQIVRDGRYLED
jgi:hypothetical protein